MLANICSPSLRHPIAPRSLACTLEALVTTHCTTQDPVKGRESKCESPSHAAPAPSVLQTPSCWGHWLPPRKATAHARRLRAGCQHRILLCWEHRGTCPRVTLCSVPPCCFCLFQSPNSGLWPLHHIALSPQNRLPGASALQFLSPGDGFLHCPA